ncbi:hypothetical protein GGI04_004468 [Coemansia thaxteri]|nr:hypothetical protein GGI04_004468 [Coemansia thaxteri]KAJ2476852.1 hypothetical protein EV174_004798 [Coemansia sp. RSA 2320]
MPRQSKPSSKYIVAYYALHSGYEQKYWEVLFNHDENIGDVVTYAKSKSKSPHNVIVYDANRNQHCCDLCLPNVHQ